jgi:hypothetical protein
MKMLVKSMISKSLSVSTKKKRNKNSISKSKMLLWEHFYCEYLSSLVMLEMLAKA